MIDYNTPGMSGIEVARAARMIRKGLPDATTSGHIDDELQTHADAAGVQELIPKPCFGDALIAIIERLVSPATD